MESKINTSKIQILLGQDPAESKKFNLNGTIALNQSSIQAQTEKLNNLFNADDLQSSVVIRVRIGNRSKETVQEKVDLIIANYINDLVEGGMVTVKTTHTSDHINVIIRPAAVGEMIDQQIEGVLAMGVGDLLQNQQNSIGFNISSAKSLEEFENGLNEGTQLEKLFFASTKVELSLNLDQNVISSVFDLLNGIGMDAEATPLGILKIFRDLQIELKFTGPDDANKIVFETKKIFPQDAYEVFKLYLIPLLKTLNEGTEIYVTSKVAALEIKLN